MPSARGSRRAAIAAEIGPGASSDPVPVGPTNPTAIASLVVSIVSLVGLCGMTSIVGAVLGHVARHQVRERHQHGAGLALAGLVLGWAGTALFAAFLAVVAILVVRER